MKRCLISGCCGGSSCSSQEAAVCGETRPGSHLTAWPGFAHQCCCRPRSCAHDIGLLVMLSLMQIRDLNSGTFGFVQLARDKQTGEMIACKFIERGDKVGVSLMVQAHSLSGWLAAWQAGAAAADAVARKQDVGADPCPVAGAHNPFACAACNRLPSMWSVRSSTTGAWCTLTSCSSRRWASGRACCKGRECRQQLGERGEPVCTSKQRVGGCPAQQQLHRAAAAASKRGAKPSCCTLSFSWLRHHDAQHTG